MRARSARRAESFWHRARAALKRLRERDSTSHVTHPSLIRFSTPIECLWRLGFCHATSERAHRYVVSSLCCAVDLSESSSHRGGELLQRLQPGSAAAQRPHCLPACLSTSVATIVGHERRRKRGADAESEPCGSLPSFRRKSAFMYCHFFPHAVDALHA